MKKRLRKKLAKKHKNLLDARSYNLATFGVRSFQYWDAWLKVEQFEEKHQRNL